MKQTEADGNVNSVWAILRTRSDNTGSVSIFSQEKNPVEQNQEMDVFFSIFFYLLLFLALYVLSQHLLNKLQNLPPSPLPSLPLIGHLYLLQKPLHKTLCQLSRKYGPVLFLRFGSRRVLIVSSPSAAQQCLSKNDIVFANRPRLVVGKYLGYNYTSVAWAPYGDHWRNLRRISSVELLSTHRLQALSHVRLDEVRTLIHNLHQISSKNPGHKLEMRNVFFEITFNIMTRLIAGKRFYGKDVAVSEEAKAFHEIVKETNSITSKTNMVDFIPILRCFMFKEVDKKYIMLKEKRDKFMQNLIEGLRSESSDASSGNREKTLIEILLSLQKTDPEYYTDESIRSLMLVLLQGGSETSAETMEWAMTHLLENPEVLTKAQAEIDNLVGADRLIDEQDVAGLPYLRCIITETLRIHPVAPLLLPHESSEECIVDGFRIPPRTMLLVNVSAIQNDPKIWEEPEKFEPKRHQSLERVKEGFNFKFMPFGSGRRGCPGEALAMRIMELALGSLIHCFDWEKACSDEREDMAEVGGFTTPKAKPLVAKCWPRTTMANLLSRP